MTEAIIPNEIDCESQIFDICFHPLASFLAIGQVSGAIDVYQINDEANTKVLSLSKHKKACRGLLFSEDGQTLYSISSDKSILAVDASGQKKWHLKKAHDDAVNKIISLQEPNIFATGDDSGVVKIWDARASMAEVMKWQLHEEFVSGLAYDADSHNLVSVGGDATLCSYDTRHKSNTFRSDEQESEICCVEFIKDHRKVACGTQEGVVLIFSTGRWGDCSDRYVGHPHTIDCMLKIDEATILTGSSDGMIRVMSVLPNKILGVIGDQEEFPVEGIRRSNDGKVFASFSHDEVVRFYDASMLFDDLDVAEEMDAEATTSASATASASTAAVSSDMMDDEMRDDDEDSDDDSDDEDDNNEDIDDSDDEDEKPTGSRRKILTPAQRFYSDL